MTVTIYGLRNLYKIKDPAGTLEKIVEEIRNSEDPPEYSTEEMEKILDEIAKRFKISRMEVYLDDVSIK